MDNFTIPSHFKIAKLFSRSSHSSFFLFHVPSDWPNISMNVTVYHLPCLTLVFVSVSTKTTWQKQQETANRPNGVRCALMQARIYRQYGSALIHFDPSLVGEAQLMYVHHQICLRLRHPRRFLHDEATETMFGEDPASCHTPGESLKPGRASTNDVCPFGLGHKPHHFRFSGQCDDLPRIWN